MYRNLDKIKYNRKLEFICPCCFSATKKADAKITEIADDWRKDYILYQDVSICKKCFYVKAVLSNPIFKYGLLPILIFALLFLILDFFIDNLILKICISIIFGVIFYCVILIKIHLKYNIQILDNQREINVFTT